MPPILPRRRLGNTGLEVSLLSLGTVKLGRTEGVRYPTRFELPSDEDFQALLRLARDGGLNLLDTAPSYGVSELRLGQLLKGQRERWLLCSKVGEAFEQGQSSYDFRPEAIRASVERSLSRLNTDRLDILLIHSDGQDVKRIVEDGALETLTRLKQEGKTRAIGISSKTVEGGLLGLEHSDCVMVTLNLGHLDELPVITRAAALQKGVLIKKAFAYGHACVSDLVDPVRASLKLCLDQPGVSSVVVGTINPVHLRENIQAACTLITP
ncbi:MAG: aldo/keto reductase [Myxococcota bacterium]